MRMNFVDSFVWDLSAIFNLFYRTGPKTFWTRNSSRNYCTSPSRSLRTNFAQFIHSFIVENIRICAFVLLCLCVRRLFSYKLFNHMVRFIKYVFTFSRFSLSLSLAFFFAFVQLHPLWLSSFFHAHGQSTIWRKFFEWNICLFHETNADGIFRILESTKAEKDKWKYDTQFDCGTQCTDTRCPPPLRTIKININCQWESRAPYLSHICSTSCRDWRRDMCAASHQHNSIALFSLRVVRWVQQTCLICLLAQFILRQQRLRVFLNVFAYPILVRGSILIDVIESLKPVKWQQHGDPYLRNWFHWIICAWKRISFHSILSNQLWLHSHYYRLKWRWCREFHRFRYRFLNGWRVVLIKKRNRFLYSISFCVIKYC